MKIPVLLLLALLVCDAACAACLARLSQVHAISPCTVMHVDVPAYLNASRHGAWLSETAGSMRNAVRLSLPEQAHDPSVERIKRYLYRPQDHLNQTLHARFQGTLTCNAEPDGRSIRIDKATDIVMSSIRDVQHER